MKKDITREEYLKEQACCYDLEYSQVKAIADALGEDEDYDGLITALDDLTGGCY